MVRFIVNNPASGYTGVHMEDQLNALRLTAEQELKNVKNASELEQFEIQYLGRKGELASIMKGLGGVSAEDRPKMGALMNEVKQAIEVLTSVKRTQFDAEASSRLGVDEWVDVTESGARPLQGHSHLVTQAINEISSIFEKIGFVRTRYPEVDWDWYSFEALNMPPDHPARDEWETFFMNAPTSKLGKMVLTPHATNGTARNLAEKQLPIRSVNIAKTYRRQIDVTHVPMFHQFDGLVVDKGIAITHLRGVLDYFAKEFFGPTRQIRLRPFHFRFTEPSFEIDVSCGVCDGKGVIDGAKCRTCKRGWLELGGAGMLHPNVLKAAGLDPNVYSGLAFGWGVERTYMMKSGIKLDDIRTLYENDVRFLEQF